MTKRETYEAKAEKFITPIIEANGFELVDVEYVKEAGNWYLRAYIDKPGGITIDDCEVVSRAFNEVLDREDFIEDVYTMEISSPGLDRPLRKDKDFERYTGSEVEVRLYKAVDGEKQFRGILSAWDKDTITIELDEGTQRLIKRGDCALIRLAFDY